MNSEANVNFIPGLCTVVQTDLLCAVSFISWCVCIYICLLFLLTLICMGLALLPIGKLTHLNQTNSNLDFVCWAALFDNEYLLYLALSSKLPSAVPSVLHRKKKTTNFFLLVVMNSSDSLFENH